MLYWTEPTLQATLQQNWKGFDIKTQIVQLKRNHKPTDAWACLSFSKKSGKFTIIQQEILKAHKCTSISIAKIP